MPLFLMESQAETYSSILYKNPEKVNRFSETLTQPGFYGKFIELKCVEEDQ